MTRDPRKDLEICNKATPGEWGWDREETGCDSETGLWGEPPSFWLPRKEGEKYHRGYSVCSNADAEFIATAREALPYYIKRCMELEAEVDRLSHLKYLHKSVADQWQDRNDLFDRNQELEAQVGQMREALEKVVGVSWKQGAVLCSASGLGSVMADIYKALRTPAPARWDKMQRVIKSATQVVNDYAGDVFGGSIPILANALADLKGEKQ